MSTTVAASPLLLTALAATLVAWPAEAQSPRDRQQARQHADAGLKHFEAGEYQDAISEFEKAEALIHAPPHLLYIARAQAKLGELASARAHYQRIIDEDLGADAPPPFVSAQKDAEAELEVLEARIPKLLVSVTGAPDALVTLDGEVIATGEPIEVGVGKYRVEASAPGFASESREIDVTADADFPLRIELALTAVETDTDSDDSGAIIGPAVIMGAGAVGLVIGAATGGAALSTASTLKDRCGDTNPCAREHAPLKDEATTLATASTVSLVVGGVLLAGGATWLVIGLMSGDDGGDPGGDELALDLELNLGGAGLSGRF